MNKKLSGIYKITNIVNKKFYIGSSIDIIERWRVHRRDLRKGTKNNKKFQRAWNKYKEVNFKFEIIEICEIKDLFKREQYYLDTLLFAQEYLNNENRIFLKLGYNIRALVERKEKSDRSKFSGRKNSKKVVILSKNGDLLNECVSLAQAAFYLNSDASSVLKVCKRSGKQRTVKNRICMFKEEYLKMSSNELKRVFNEYYLKSQVITKEKSFKIPLAGEEINCNQPIDIRTPAQKRMKAVIIMDQNFNYIEEVESVSAAIIKLDSYMSTVSQALRNQRRSVGKFKNKLVFKENFASLSRKYAHF